MFGADQVSVFLRLLFNSTEILHALPQGGGVGGIRDVREVGTNLLFLREFCLTLKNFRNHPGNRRLSVRSTPPLKTPMTRLSSTRGARWRGGQNVGLSIERTRVRILLLLFRNFGNFICSPNDWIPRYIRTYLLHSIWRF